MPVREVTIDGERGYRWGDAGAFYPFDPDSEASRERARAKAELQGEVIQRRRAAASGLSFVPPQAVRAAARRALDLRAPQLYGVTNGLKSQRVLRHWPW